MAGHVAVAVKTRETEIIVRRAVYTNMTVTLASIQQ